MKKFCSLVLCSCALLLFSGCYSFANNHRNVMDVFRHFKDSGMEVDVVQPLFAYFDSESAISMKMNGKEIGIYKYNVTVQKQRERLERIKKDNFVYVEGKKYPVITNGTFMLLGYEVNPQRDRIIEVFNSFPN